MGQANEKGRLLHRRKRNDEPLATVKLYVRALRASFIRFIPGHRGLSLVDGDHVDHMAKSISYLARWSRLSWLRISQSPGILQAAVAAFKLPLSHMVQSPRGRSQMHRVPFPSMGRTVDYGRDMANVHRRKRTSFRRRGARKTETEFRAGWALGRGRGPSTPGLEYDPR